MLLLALNGIVDRFLDNVGMEGIITASSLSFHFFNEPGSVLAGHNFSTTAALNDVWLIGPDHVNAARDILDLFGNLPTAPEWEDIEKVEEFFESVWDLVEQAIEAAENAVEIGERTSQPPDLALFVDFGVLCFDCIELVWNQGFNSVYSPGGINIPSPVLIIVRNLETQSFAFQLHNFFRAAPR